MTFKELNLSESILTAIAEMGYENPTPIQEQAIPLILAGNDLIGCAQTGTGKTAAFGLPLLELLDFDTNQPQALVLRRSLFRLSKPAYWNWPSCQLSVSTRPKMDMSCTTAQMLLPP